MCKPKLINKSNSRKSKSPIPGQNYLGTERPSSVSSVHSEGDYHRQTPGWAWEDRPSSTGKQPITCLWIRWCSLGKNFSFYVITWVYLSYEILYLYDPYITVSVLCCGNQCFQVRLGSALPQTVVFSFYYEIKILTGQYNIFNKSMWRGLSVKNITIGACEILKWLKCKVVAGHVAWVQPTYIKTAEENELPDVVLWPSTTSW